MRQLAQFLHSILCERPHADNMGDMLKERHPQVCYWYLEEKVAETDRNICHDHLLWEQEAQNLCDQLEMNEMDAIRALHAVLEARRILNPLLSRSVKSRELVVRLLRLPAL